MHGLRDQLDLLIKMNQNYLRCLTLTTGIEKAEVFVEAGRARIGEELGGDGERANAVILTGFGHHTFRRGRTAICKRKKEKDGLLFSV